MNWISVKDRLPSEACGDKYGDVLAVQRYVNGKHGAKVINWQEVVAYPDAYPYWMQIPTLPEPPGGEGEGWK